MYLFLLELFHFYKNLFLKPCTYCLVIITHQQSRTDKYGNQNSSLFLALIQNLLATSCKNCIDQCHACAFLPVSQYTYIYLSTSCAPRILVSKDIFMYISFGCKQLIVDMINFRFKPNTPMDPVKLFRMNR